MNGEIKAGMYFDPINGARLRMIHTSYEGKDAWCAMYYFGYVENGGPVYPAAGPPEKTRQLIELWQRLVPYTGQKSRGDDEWLNYQSALSMVKSGRHDDYRPWWKFW